MASGPLRYLLIFASAFLLLFSSFTIASYAEDIQKPPKPVKMENVNPKLQTVLQEMCLKSKQNLSQAKKLAQTKGIPLVDNQVTVIIEPKHDQAAFIDQVELKRMGGEVEATSQSLLRAKVPVNRLTEVANRVDGIELIRLPYRPHPTKVDTSEGVAKTGAVDAHDAGYYGQGTKIAIIDVGFDHLTEAKDSGDLPSDVIAYANDYTDDNNIEAFTNHGTDVAEIVHDMAPQAELYLMKIGDEVDLQNAKDDAISKGVDVINHSVGWYNTSYYDGTGVIAEVAADARDNGILWVNAAGNSAQTHWQGDFSDPDGDDWHEFSGGDQLNSLGTISAGSIIGIMMTWNAWPHDSEDYDLYLYNSSGNVVASSTNYQTASQQPTERILGMSTTTDEYSFSILNRDAPTKPEIEVFVLEVVGDINLEYRVEESSISAPGNDEKVMTVGAINYLNWASGPQEAFSSRGPTNSSKYASPRIKPDIMGPDRVSTSGFGTFPGTSAASPHIAGAAALLLSKDSTRTVDELPSLLESAAVDMGTSGKDNIYGSGRLELGPGKPDISSSTHPSQNTWYSDDKPSFSWEVPTSPTGVSGYSYELNQQKTAIPDKTVDTTKKTKSYKDVGDGVWYFHLRAKGEGGIWGPTEHYRINIDTTPPTADFSFSPGKPTTQDEVQFNDNSSDAGSGIASWNWEFGDGASSSGQNPEHLYDDDGTYTVKLTAEDNVGLTADISKDITVLNVGPTASFTYTPSKPKSTENVQFTDQSTDVDGTVESFSWEFGGGGTSNKENPTHKYLASGEFTVQLKVTDDDGATSSTADTIDVQNVPPTADFSFFPEYPFVDERVNFKNESSDPEGNMERYEWEFGDGSTSHQKNPTHEYVDDLTYTVKLTVEDVHGLTDSIEKEIQVTNPTEEMGSYSPNSPSDVDNPDQFIGRKEAHYAVWSFLSGEKLPDLNRRLPKKWAREVISYHLLGKKIPQDEDQQASDQARQAARHLTQAFLKSSLPRKVSTVLTTLDNDDPIDSLTIRVFSTSGKLEYKDSCTSVNQDSWDFLLERVRTELESGTYLYLIKARETDGEVRRTDLKKLFVKE